MFLKWIETFCKVVENKSFSLTAKELCITQPSVSIQISQLEKELGIILINRANKKITLTKAGEIFYYHCLGILNNIEKLRFLMDDFKGVKTGSLSVGASTLPGEYVIPQIVNHFKNDFPGIELEIFIQDTFHILENVKKGVIEIGIVGSMIEDNELEFNKFLEDEIVLAANYEYQLENVTLDNIKNIQLISREKASGTIHTVIQCLKNYNIDYEKLNILAKVNSLNGLKSLIKSGLAPGFVSKKAIEDEINHKIIKVIDFKPVTPIKRNFYIVTSKIFTQSPAVEKFKKYLCC